MRIPRVAAALACAALLIFVCSRCLVPMDETDLFFNLRLGEIILATHRIPRTNLLSFTFPDVRDVNLAWLFQIVLALAHRAAGIAGTVLLKTAFVATTFACLWRVARRRGAHPAAAALALALATWAAEPRFVERPHLVTFLGLALLLLAIERAEQGAPKLLFAFPALGLLWANGNSCFFLAPLVLILYAIGARIEGRTAESRRAALVALALVPVAFATPSALGVISYVANHIRMPWLRPLQEYRSAEWPLDGPFFFLAGAVVAAATSARLFAAGPLLPSRHLLPLAALGALGSRRIRFVAEFALLAGPAVAGAATRAARRLRQESGTHARLSLVGVHAPDWLAVVAGVALVALALVPRVAAARAGRPWLDLSIEPDLVPAAAIDFIEHRGLAERMYNDMEVGSYLTWRWWPRHRVFQDPRINGYPESFHALLRRTDLDRPTWQAFLDRFGVQAALVSYPALNPRATLFDPARWALVFRDREALVFVARGAAHARLISDAEIPLTFTAKEAAGSAPEPLVVRPPEPAPAACEWSLRLADQRLDAGDLAGARTRLQEAIAEAGCLSAVHRDEARAKLGAADLRLGQPQEALAALDGLTAPDAAANRGYALLAVGRGPDALATFDATLARAPSHAEAQLGRALALEATGRTSDARDAWLTFVKSHPGHLGSAFAAARLSALGTKAP